MTNNKWATIVYSRTYEVDFRLITIPNDFNNERIDWLQKYINSTTRYPQKLPQNPCWSLFKDHKHCVVGVTCMVKDILGDSPEENLEDITKDVYGRDLFVFVGYVAKIPHPPIPSMNLELFKELYNNSVRPRWKEKSYEVRAIENERKNLSSYEKIFDLEDCIKLPQNLEQYIFNQNLNQRLVWSISANLNLWYVASQADRSLSICLGLSSKKYFLEGEFLNGTALDVIGDDRYSYSEILEKPKEIAHKELQKSEKLEDDRDQQFNYAKSGIEGLLQFVQKGNKKAFSEARKQVENTIKGLQDNISKHLNSEELHTKIDQILRDFEEITKQATELFGSGDKYDSRSHNNLNQEQENKSKTDSLNIEIDYGFKKKSDQDNPQKTKKKLDKDNPQPKNWF